MDFDYVIRALKRNRILKEGKEMCLIITAAEWNEQRDTPG